MQVTITGGKVIGTNGKPLTSKELAEIVSSHRVATASERKAQRVKDKVETLAKARKTLATRKEWLKTATERVTKLEQELAELKAS